MLHESLEVVVAKVAVEGRRGPMIGKLPVIPPMRPVVHVVGHPVTAMKPVPSGGTRCMAGIRVSRGLMQRIVRMCANVARRGCTSGRANTIPRSRRVS
jgi:hypothetical protein